jgi:hypothetical protein
MRMQKLSSRLAGLLFFAIAPLFADFPRGFFVEDLRRTPPIPAFFNVETRRVEPLKLLKPYVDILDATWDQEHGRVFFSGRLDRKEPFKIYMKSWPDGEEKVVYENPTGPFRFLLSPDGTHMVLQVMGPSAWPILGVYDWQNPKWTALGQGYSPDWSADGKKLLFLKIPGALPTWLHEYDVDTDTTTQLIDEPVMEAVYTDDASQIILKTAGQSKKCDAFHIWNRRAGSFKTFCVEDPALCRKKSISQRQLTAFPGHRFFFFKESVGKHDLENQSLIVTDVWGGRLQTLPYEEWNPQAIAVEAMSLAISEDPIFVLPADGAGGKVTIPQARFFRVRR